LTGIVPNDGAVTIGGSGGIPMNARTVRAAAATALTAGLIVGCESSPPRTTYGDNPLLQARQPLVQSQGAPAADPTQVAQSSPRTVVVPPPGLYQRPPAGVAASPTDPRSNSALVMSSRATTNEGGPALPPPSTAPTSTATPAPLPMPIPLAAAEPADVVPAVAPAALAPPPVTQAAVRTVEGKYGHAADYSWLQGELDRHYRGQLELRYRPLSEEDPYGGKVRLEEDPRLAEFRPGDVIAVEGELLTDPDGGAAPWSQYLRYHIRAVRLVDRK
jgi:hypothetical protein